MSKSTTDPTPAVRKRAAPRKRKTPKAGTAAAVSPTIQREREQVFNVLRPLVDMLSSMLGDNVEIVLHDLTRLDGSVVALANGHVSGRTVGHPILGGPRGDQALNELTRQIGSPDPDNTGASVIKDYQTATPSGKELRSATCFYRDRTGTPFAALCMNADMTVVRMAHAWLQGQLGQAPRISPSEKGAPPMDALMRDVITDAVGRFGKPARLMSKEEKITATEIMKRNGLFIVKGGVEKAAQALGVTRFTIYNYLEELRQRE